jgi:hypothetical protein
MKKMVWKRKVLLQKKTLMLGPRQGKSQFQSPRLLILWPLRPPLQHLQHQLTRDGYGMKPATVGSQIQTTSLVSEQLMLNEP